MRNQFFIGLLCLLAFTGLGHTNTFKLGLISDLTASSNYTRSLDYLQRAASLIHARGINQAIALGDLVESFSGEMEVQFEQVTGILEGSGIALRATAAGDHDVVSEFRQGSNNRTNEQLYRRLMMEYGFPVFNKLYYAVYIDGLLIVVLYNFDPFLGTEPRWGNTFLNQLDELQRDWLQGVLEANQALPVLVILHQPAWYQPDNWYPVHRVLREHPKILAVIAGHFHYSQICEVLDGIQYYVVGSTGGDTKRGTPSVGDVRLYGVLDFNLQGLNSTLDFKLYSIDNPLEGPLHVPSFEAMDRVQSQNVISGGLPYGYITMPPSLYYNSSSKLIGDSCNASAPATIQLIAGNAIDIDQVFSIELHSEIKNLFQFKNSTFVEGQWKQVVNETAAVIARGKNVDNANRSTNQLVSYYSPIVNMWTGVLKVAHNKWPGIDTKMTFFYSNSFVFQNQTFYQYWTIDKLVIAC